MSQTSGRAAEIFHCGSARHSYVLSKEILLGTAARECREKEGSGVCVACRSLLDLKDVFQGFVHSGRALSKRKVIYSKPADTTYYDLTKQNDFLVKSVFDGKGNYLYHSDCIHGAYFRVSNQRLSRLRKGIQVETNDPAEFAQKQDICMARPFSDVVLPQNCKQPAGMWLDSQGDDAVHEASTERYCPVAAKQAKT